MIKIENDTFYISAGEACYIFKIADGVPTHTYFGKRVEPEDDLSALGCGGKTKELYVQAVTGGKKKELDFSFVDAWIMKDDDGNDKSLVVELCDDNAKLKATMYYTPHPRGGIYRRVTIKHTDSGDVQLALVRQSIGCGCADNVDNNSKDCEFFSAFGGEYSGDAYGFLCPNGDGNVAVKQSGDGITATCEIGATITIYDFDTAECPELLCVYSDIGKGGMSRIFHDILREDGEDEHLSERAAVLFLPKMELMQIVAAVKAAGELGFGVVALDGGRHTRDEIYALGVACKENGLIAGLRINREFIEETSALRTNICKAFDGIYKYDNSDEHTAMLYHAVRYSLSNFDIKYVMIDAPKNATSRDVARGMFALRNMIKYKFEDIFGDLRVDFCLRSDDVKAYTAYYPLTFIRNIINPTPENFKSRFDVATLGALGYEFNPTELSDGIKRAVRGQILSYQDDARCVLRGDIYSYGNGVCRMAVRKDKSRAYAVCFSKGERIKFLGLDEHNIYNVRELNKTFSGAALVHCGIAVGEGTYVFHILQVADY
ncbi:MAG: GH36 C-terminal domain-containing protein [Clostridiales bacterium]|nr:GH36 C-terminal domain-containing protein [Clostridiales bacterium]